MAHNERHSTSLSAISDSGTSRNHLGSTSHDHLAQFSVAGPSSVSITPRKRPSGPKNLQACDRCRQKKTKCIPRDSTRDECVSCHIHNIGCTFDLPLTVSRTKRVKRGLDGGHTKRSVERGGRGGEEDFGDGSGLGLLAVHAAGQLREQRVDAEGSERVQGGYPPLRRPKDSTARYGPTSAYYIFHSAPSLPLYRLREYDSNHRIQLIRPSTGHTGRIEKTRLISPHSSTNLDTLEITQSPTWNDTLSLLVDEYFLHRGYITPFIEAEGLQDPTGCGVLEYTMALLGATKSSCSKDVFDALRHIVNIEVDRQDIMYNPTRQNIQILLLLSMSDDFAAEESVSDPSTIARGRLSRAIQMCRDLGMDRSEQKDDVDIWRSAFILDQWQAVKYGTTPMIPFSAVLISSPPEPDEEFYQRNMFIHHLLLISTILSRILSHIYGPKGIIEIDPARLQEIRADLKQAKDGLPDNLRLTSLSSSHRAGILHFLHLTAQFLFYRPFMRWSFDVNERFSMDLDLRVWEGIRGASTASLDWITAQSDPSGLLFWMGYGVHIASFVQYHHWARRRESSGIIMLEKVVNSIDKWMEGDKLGSTKEELSLVRLLFDSTDRLSHIPPADLAGFDRGLDPTPGSYNRKVAMEDGE